MNDLPVESNQLLLLWLNKAGFQIDAFSLVLPDRDFDWTRVLTNRHQFENLSKVEIIK